MQRFGRIARCLVAAGALAPALGACSSDIGLSNVTFAAPKSEAPARKPDWTTYSGNKNEFTLRPVAAEDLVGPDGQCALAAGAVAAVPGEPVLPAGTPTIQGGIVLQMTECDVVRRAGLAEKVDLGTNERGERAVVLTFTRGAVARHLPICRRPAVLDRAAARTATRRCAKAQPKARQEAQPVPDRRQAIAASKAALASSQSSSAL